MELVYLLIFSGIFLTIQIIKSRNGAAVMKTVGIFTGIFIGFALIKNMVVSTASRGTTPELDESRMMLTVSYILLAISIGFAVWYFGRLFLAHLQTTPEQREAQKQADKDFAEFCRIKQIWWDTYVSPSDIKRVLAEHPELDPDDPNSVTSARWIYKEEYCRKIFKQSTGREYTGSVWWPAVIGPDGKPVEAPDKQPTEEKKE